VDPKNASASASPANQNGGWSLTSSASWLKQNRFLITGHTVIGRDPSCDIHIPLDHLSRRHTELDLHSGQLVLKDLGSANGTYVNGQRVEETALKPGDKIKLDVLTFEVSGPTHDPHKTIIRSAPAPTPPTGSATTAPTKKAASARPEGIHRAVGGSPQRKLVSEGKQEWLNGQEEDRAREKNGQRSRTGLMLLVLSGLLAVISTAVLIARYI
jgi:predicted component of type VI protein secretion system